MLFHQASDPDYWRKLNPNLKISERTSNIALEALRLDQSLIGETKNNLCTEGYFNLFDVFDKATMDLLASGVKNVWEAGWPTPFAVVYDEYWQLFRALEPLFSSILGTGYKQIPNFWCWYIDNNNSSKGWGLHRDRPSANTILPDGSSNTLTVWIPLTDATVLNGCIYLLPAHLDPNYPGNLESFAVPDLQSLRALPANKGSVLGWTEAILHMGTRSSRKASEPRVSISYSFQRSDVDAYETPLFDPMMLPSFEERLGLIGQNVVKYSSHGNYGLDILTACNKLSNHIPAILVEDGFKNEILDADKPLSKTTLWPLQEEYFTRENIRAWEKVPFYVTSRAPFCESYADMVLAFLLDHKEELNYDHELFIVELGGGTGCFAYRFLNELTEKIESFSSLQRLKIRYVLTDFTENIVNNWLDNKKLARHRQTGKLDFAVFRPDKDDSLKLLHSERQLTSREIVNPLIVIANYVFDSLEQDAFRVDRGVLQETRFTVYRNGRDCSLESPASIEELRTVERYFDIEGKYYGQPELDAILDYYRFNLNQASVIFPIGGLRAASNLLKLANDEMVLIVSDKGFNSVESRQIRGLWPHQFSVHGSFSFDVNFDAISRYFENRGGTSLSAESNQAGLCTSANIILKHKQNTLEHLKHYFKDNLSKKNLVNSSFDIEELISTWPVADEMGRSWIDVFISIVQTYNFEPVVFTIAFHRLFEKFDRELDKMEKDQKLRLLNALGRVSRNIYMIDQKHDSLDCLLRFYVEIKCFDECLKLCQDALEAFGPIGSVLDHFAICYESTGRAELANKYFQDSLKLKPDHDWAKAGFERTKKPVGWS